MTELQEQTITSVLLIDGWHPVVAGSFKIDRAKFPGTAAGDVSFAVHTATWQEAHNSTPPSSSLPISQFGLGRSTYGVARSLRRIPVTIER
jgi:hypothetical protein